MIRQKQFIAHVSTTLADLIFPPWCLSCYQPGGWLCADCRGDSPLLPLGWCGSCGRRAVATMTLCQKDARALHLTRGVSAWPYQGPVEQMIQAIKYRPARVGLKALVTEEVRVRLSSAVPAAAHWVPIPLKAAHQAERDFNQADELARLLVRASQVYTHHLIRTHDVPAQVGLARSARLANMEGVFRWAGPNLAGQTIVLVDDVLTTGATLADAARAVRAAGARRVVAITLAQTPPGRANSVSKLL